MTLTFLTIALMVTAAVMLFITGVIVSNNPISTTLETGEKPTKKPLITIILAMICLVASVFTWAQARENIQTTYHLTEDQATSLTNWEYVTLPMHTALEANIPLDADNTPDLDALSGKIIVFIKPLCGDCEAVHHDLMQLKTQRPDIVFVNTQSPAGKILIQEYTISEVPSAVYITLGETQNYYKYVLYEDDLDYVDPDGTRHYKTVYAEDSMLQLLQAQDAGW